MKEKPRQDEADAGTVAEEGIEEGIEEPDRSSREMPEEIEEVPVLRNYIRLFGEFYVLDRDGNDITSLFTPKLKTAVYLDYASLFPWRFRDIEQGLDTDDLGGMTTPRKVRRAFEAYLY